MRSLNGIFLNEVLIGKGKTAVVPPNITVHFTKPGLQSRGAASELKRNGDGELTDMMNLSLLRSDLAHGVQV